MKMFWKILGVPTKLYTGKAVKYVIDKTSGKKYYTGEGQLYTQKNYPDNLVENAEKKYDLCYGVPLIKRPDLIETKGLLGKTRHVYFTPPTDLEREYLNIFGLWKIEGLELYTDLAVTYIRDKNTKKEYRRGERVLFFNEDAAPFPLAEHTNRYEYIYEIDDSFGLSPNDYLREIALHTLFKKH